MATLRTGPKTQRAGLPQRPALESASSDHPQRKRKGSHTGRVLVRAGGGADTTADAGRAGIGHGRGRLLQRPDGYAYTTGKETGVSAPV
ncbi:hypothetical protein [Nocardiopsis sp. YSL2]|uniref:hypothetical protein n=1 Tax=Nocardiopsis sp. YSL2 TaxID=2939492 RepID=UPI0026F44F6B|nr:hypothetical protein [Nocardiopsis sp. YSL2]